ncbi:hypothetical protein [Aromatoleum diolicum]|uniref:Doubled CXXCH motif domain-containing protein n=1 Tax=Aromatoleum diolicum TaxID=75796 RepID=A0ABX1QBN7_9RHOO|nr:hypothetical protein [Aromatoleum diolicum]NMG75789.1 hypothetical protein [Aromatoleum diolicum]
MAFSAIAAARAEYSDCRTCHYATSVDNAAPDLTGYFVAPGHHPVRVSYPSRADYHQPGGSQSGILFFDQNGNGQADPDEIQLFSSSTTSTTGTTGTRTRSSKATPKGTADAISWVIDCASCHTEHGTTTPDPTHTADYVRGAGGERLLCTTCHNL